MSQTRVFVVLAGAALSFTSAMAQTSLNQDRAYNAELQADSLSRANLQGGGGGFKISDGAFTLQIGGLYQTRYNMNWAGEGSAGRFQRADNNKFYNGFNQRIKLTARGTIADPNLSYGFQGDFATDGGAFNLDDAWGKYKWENGVYAKWGQFKLPFSREELVGDGYQLSAERSFENSTFTLGRSQALEFGIEQDVWRAMLAFSDGLRAQNTDFNSASEADWAFTGRADFKWAGEWDRFKDFTSFRGQGYAGMAGLGLHWEDEGSTGNGGPFGAVTRFEGNNTIAGTLDVSGEGDGWNIYAAFNAVRQDPSTPNANSLTDFGWVLQGGFFLTDNFELFARYDGIRADDDHTVRYTNSTTTAPTAPNNAISSISTRTLHFVSLGTNYYLVPGSHAAKFTAAVVIGLSKTDEIMATTNSDRYSSSGYDILGTEGGTKVGTLGSSKSGEVGLQLQFQIMF